MASPSGRSPLDGKITYEVKQVYVYIPAEQSAAGFELKIAGLVRILTKPSGDTVLYWEPEELSYQDVSSLYSCDIDGWTIVDEDDVDNQIVDQQPRTSNIYPSLPVDDIEPIVSTDRAKTNAKKATSKPIKHEGPQMKPTPIKPAFQLHPDSPVMFPLANLKCVKEGSVSKRSRVQSLTFFLTDGKELPKLHFYDGGTSGLIQSMKRYLYLVRDGKDSRYLRVEDSPFVSNSSVPKRISDSKGVEGLISSAVLEVGKRVRHGFRNTREMSEERPHPPVINDNERPHPSESDDKPSEDDEISTLTCHGIDKKPNDLTPDPDMSLITDFQVISDLTTHLPPCPPTTPRLSPLGREEWEGYRQLDGRISAEKEREFRARVFAGGIEHELRREVWKYLLGYFKFDATDVERMEMQKERADQYEIMKQQWKSFLPIQENNWHKWRDVKHLVEKDVIRTDRELDMYHSLSSPSLEQLQNILTTFIMYNFDLGYVQGMSDFLAPLLSVMDNECDAFWCFVGLMEMVGHYFEETQNVMRLRIRRLRALLNVLEPKFYQFLKDKDSGNLYFAFRWLLIDFKREFEYNHVMCIWEVLWTHHLSPDYAMFIALAIIEQEKEELHKESNDFSDIIAHINNLSKTLDYNPILMKAESICKQIAAVQNLPEELQMLINSPFPQPTMGNIL